jgi:hypothetical protein
MRFNRRQHRPALCAIAFPDTDTVKVWCPACVAPHTHGNGPGHRVAHCATKTDVSGSALTHTEPAFTMRGYYLVAPADLVAQLPPEQRARWRGWTVA